MTQQDILHLAALLHDIGKFRQRATERFKKHQQHSYEFVNEDFSAYFSPCGTDFSAAILNHHTHGNNLLEKQVILADRLSATEREDEEREAEDFVQSPLVSILSRLKCADREHRYKLKALNFDRDTIIPKETVSVDQKAYADLWKEFTDAFSKATAGRTYTPSHYQTIVALLHKYTSRMPSATPWELREEKTVPDISLYDHLRTTAAIATCIGRELTDETEVDALFNNLNKSDYKICALIKGDISGIQNFLYHIQSDGASNQLRGRSFYLQLLMEAIAHWVLKQLDLPITNLILASGGHFIILAPYTATKNRLDTLRKQISGKLWELHKEKLYCLLDYTDVEIKDFLVQRFSNKWGEVSDRIHLRKQKKWSEMEAKQMFDNLFVPQENKEVDFRFEDLSRLLRNAKYMIAFEVSSDSTRADNPTWRDAIKVFGWDIQLDTETIRPSSEQTDLAVVYRLGDTDFLTDGEKYRWDDITVSYDFRIFRPVIAITDEGDTADYNYLANASEGVKWFGALRMDVDNLGTVFTEKLENATISRLATLSEAMCFFFEGYVPQLCKDFNENRDKEILELIYAGGDDLFLVGGWSALSEIAERIRSDFHDFITGDHVTLSGGIAIEHMKFPLYQLAELSGDAEDAAKNIDDQKNAISFLRKPMKWDDFGFVREWHKEFMDALEGSKPLPRDILTRISQIYSKEELKGYRWTWRSLYYFHRLQERNKDQSSFLNKLKHELNLGDSNKLRELIHVITRWTALHIRK